MMRRGTILSLRLFAACFALSLTNVMMMRGTILLRLVDDSLASSRRSVFCSLTHERHDDARDDSRFV